MAYPVGAQFASLPESSNQYCNRHSQLELVLRSGVAKSYSSVVVFKCVVVGVVLWKINSLHQEDLQVFLVSSLLIHAHQNRRLHAGFVFVCHPNFICVALFLHIKVVAPEMTS